MVLVDSSVWIDLLRAAESPRVALLRSLLEEGEAALAPVVLQEVLAGARDARALGTLRRRFTALPLLMPGADTYADAGALYARCRWKGFTPRSPHDCLIAQIAIESRVPLLQDDADFVRIAQVEPRLRLA